MSSTKLEYYAPGVKKVVPKSRGLGDTIAKITKVTGIKKVVDVVSDITGKDCGCQARQDKLNEKFPYNN